MLKRKRNNVNITFQNIINTKGLFEFIYSFLLIDRDTPYDKIYQIENINAFHVSRQTFRNLYHKLIPFIMPQFKSQDQLISRIYYPNLYALQCKIPLDFALYSTSLRKIKIGTDEYAPYLDSSGFYKKKCITIHSVEGWNCPLLENLDCRISQDGINSLMYYFPKLIKLKLDVVDDNSYIQYFYKLIDLTINMDSDEICNLFIGHMDNLESISICADLKYLNLADIPNLKKIIALDGNLEIHENIRFTGEFPNLTEIDFGYTRVSKLSSIPISILRQLTVFHGEYMDDGGMSVLLNMHNLKKLRIYNMETYETVKLTNCLLLEEVYWDYFNSKFLGIFKNLLKLRKLVLDVIFDDGHSFNSRMEWNNLEAISNLDNLVSLTIGNKTGKPKDVLLSLMNEYSIVHE